MQGLHTGVWFLEVFGRYERGAPVPDKRVLAVTWAPPGRVYTKPSQELHRINQLLGVRQETLRAVAYSKTMAHMCVVVIRENSFGVTLRIIWHNFLLDIWHKWRVLR
jgi:hypothetical protein